MDIEELKNLVKENIDEFVEWLKYNDWTMETKPKLRFITADGTALPFSLAAGMWAEARQIELEEAKAAEERARAWLAAHYPELLKALEEQKAAV